MSSPSTDLLGVRDRGVGESAPRRDWTSTDRGVSRGACLAYALLSLAYVPVMLAALGDMDVRNVGIAGYAVVLPVVLVLMAQLFAATPVVETTS